MEEISDCVIKEIWEFLFKFWDVIIWEKNYFEVRVVNLVNFRVVRV